MAVVIDEKTRFSLGVLGTVLVVGGVYFDLRGDVRGLKTEVAEVKVKLSVTQVVEAHEYRIATLEKSMTLDREERKEQLRLISDKLESILKSTLDLSSRMNTQEALRRYNKGESP